MAKLRDPVKTFIAQRLGAFDTPSQVADAVKEVFGIEITRMQAYAYDPTRPRYDLSKRWKEIFEESRKSAIDESSNTGIAHKAVRLARIERMYQTAINMGNVPLAMQLSELAAKETDGAFKNSMTGNVNHLHDHTHTLKPDLSALSKKDRQFLRDILTKQAAATGSKSG